ncbi:MAG: hypothetical protein ACAH27_20130 [Xanthobacteraceae bacterium]
MADAPEWSAYLIETLASHVLEGRAPVHEIDGEKTAWLIAALAPTGRMETARGLPLLLRLMEGARTVDPALAAFALAHLRNAIITGEGMAAAGHAHFSRTVDSADVAVLRRVLSAGGGGEGRPVSRAEADVLFDIHDATLDSANDPRFAPLFVCAIAHHLRAASGLGAGSRGAALAAATDVGGGARGALEQLAAAGYQPDLADLVDPVALAPEPAAWLADRIVRDGRSSPAERALMRLLSADRSPVQDTLRALLDRAA